MSIRNPHEMLDRIAAEQDRQIASRLRKDKRVLALARRNLKRWMANERRQRRVFVEWNLILTRLTAEEIARFLVSDTPMARRLSQSTPFHGVLSDRERMAIFRKYEKARA
jgi:hypothetical protein